MKKTTKTEPLAHAIRSAHGVERVATMARMPTGTPALDAAQDAAMAATDRALAALQRTAKRAPR